MLVMVLEKSPASLKGLLSRWLIEVRSGVFLGNPSSRVRDILWDRTVLHPKNHGYALQMWSDRGPQGFDYRSWGEGARELVDFEGVALVRQIPRGRSTKRKRTCSDGEKQRGLPGKPDPATAG